MTSDDRLKSFVESPNPVKWLFFGDSITHGVRHTFGMRDYTQHFAEYIRSSAGRVMDVVINTGISAHTTEQLLETFDWRVAQFQPHVVFLMIGMNDCSTDRSITPDQFRSNLLRLSSQITALGALPALQTSNPIVTGGHAPTRDRDFLKYMSIIREVAHESNLPLVDHLAHWENSSAGFPFSRMSDAFHPNATGHIALARHLITSLGAPIAPNAHLFQIPTP